MGLRRAACRAMALALALAAGGCATSAGEPAKGFLTPEIARAYLPLEGSAYLVLEAHGAAVAIAPGVAVTDAHNANLVADDRVIGISSDYDLMFFRTERTAPLETAAPRADEDVIAYGQGAHGLRQSYGKVLTLWPAAFGFVSDAGPGFSGGPVIDARTGALLGIVYGFLDRDGQRLMLAYTMTFVMQEWATIHAAIQAK